MEEELEVSYDLFCSSTNYKTLPTYVSNPGCIPCNYTGGSTKEGTCSDENLNPTLPQYEGLNLPECPCDRSFCQGDILVAGGAPRRDTIRERDLRLVYRYEHTDVDTGFAVKLTPIDEGPVNFLVANAMSLDPAHTLAYSYSTAAHEYLKVCPSFNRFGRGSQSITYFIFVLPGDLVGNEMATFDLSVELIPSLYDYEEEPYKLLEFWNGTSVSVNNSLSNSPFYIDGSYFHDYYNGSTPGYYVLNIMVPLKECLSYSVSFEFTHLNTTEFDYFSLIDVKSERITFDDVQWITIPRSRPYKLERVVEVTYNESKFVSASSEGRIFSACPTEGPETQEFVSVRLSAGPVFRDWSMLVFFRETSPDSRTRYNRKLHELSPLQYQRLLRPELSLRCPCIDPCDNCESRDATQIRFFNRLSGLTPETFPSLIAKAQPGCDLAAEIGVPIGDDFLFHCHSYWRDSVCGVMRVIPVLEGVNPRIYPMPLVVRLLDPFSFSVAPDFFAHPPGNESTLKNQVRSDAIGVFFTLEANDLDYLSLERLLGEKAGGEGDGCEIRFAYPTMFHNSQDMPPTSEHFHLSSFDIPEKSCSQEKFASISTLLNQTREQLSALSRSGVLVGGDEGGNEEGDSEGEEERERAEELFESSSSATYASFSLLFSEEWQSCEHLANSFLVFEETTRTVSDSSKCGSVYDPDDPCCNSDLQWETCCVAEGREIEIDDEQPLFSNGSQIKRECADSECIETFVQDYRISYQEVVLDGICENEFILTTGLDRVVADCRERWIGSDEFGMLCYSDDDCVDVFGTGLCDLSMNRCTGVREEMELGFLDCLLRDVDSVTRSAIVNEMAKSGAFDRNQGSVTAAQFRDFLISDNECVSDYGPMSHLRARYVARSLDSPDEQLCPVCYDLFCLSSFGCDWPLQCLDRRQLCGATIVPFTSPFCDEPSDSSLQCEYDDSLSRDDCDLDTPLCLFCHNSSHCVSLPASSQDECESTPLCLMPGGEVLWNVGEDECRSDAYCTEECAGDKCKDQDECESVGGFCEDPDDILESIRLASDVISNLEPAKKGVCVAPLQPFNTPACPYVTENVIARPGSFDFRTGNSWDFTSHRGCVVFSNCIPDSIQFSDGTGGARLPPSCTWEPSSPEECAQNFSGSWLPLPIENEQDCENPLRVDDDDFPGFCLEDRTGASPYLSRKGRKECEECGGIPKTPSKWRKGRWLGGLPRRAEWRKPQMVSTYHYVSDSISFLVLNDLLTLSASNVNSFLNDVSFSCGISPFEGYLSLFSCNCGEEEHEVSECQAPFQSSAGASVIGGAWMCPGVDLKVGVAVGRVEINGTLITGDLCKFAEIALAPSEVFVGNHERVPLTVLGDPNPIDAEPVRNENGASVGDVVGDGIQFLYEETGFVDFDTEVAELEITLFVDAQLLSSFPSYFVFDFGLEVTKDSEKRFSGEIEVRPMGAKLASGGEIEQSTTVGELLDLISDDEYVVELTGFWERPFKSDKSPRLYPIVRQEDYESEEENDVLSEGEKIMVAVFAALYGVAFCIAVFMLVYLYFKAPSLSNLALSFFVILAFLFRTIYLALYAAGHLRDEDASSFVLVEPPSFFVLSVASVLAMSFAFCLYCLKQNIPQEQAFMRFWMYWGLFNVLLYLVLVAVLLLMTQLDSEDDVKIDCYGRQVEVDESFTIQAIRIGYHSFLLLLASLTALSLFFLGHSLELTLQTQSLSHLSIVAGVSVLLSNILWVVYSSLSGSSPYFVIPLFSVEVPPLLLLLVMVVPKEEK